MARLQVFRKDCSDLLDEMFLFKETTFVDIKKFYDKRPDCSTWFVTPKERRTIVIKNQMLPILTEAILNAPSCDTAHDLLFCGSKTFADGFKNIFVTESPVFCPEILDEGLVPFVVNTFGEASVDFDSMESILDDLPDDMIDKLNRYGAWAQGYSDSLIQKSKFDVPEWWRISTIARRCREITTARLDVYDGDIPEENVDTPNF